uniref:Ribose-5-phosphate isomerase n=1 Tax=Caenorhabditis tropicalis TaxID=1561998 RepID=A0A1I7TC37_9PELO
MKSYQVIEKITKKSKKDTNGNEMFRETAKNIVSNSLANCDGAVGLGSGAPINMIAEEFAKQVDKVKSRQLRIICTKEWMMRYLVNHSVPAFMYHDEHDMPGLNTYIETVNCICFEGHSDLPFYIKSDATSQFSGAMLKKAKQTILIQTDSAIHSDNIRGIPMEIENNSHGWSLFKNWGKTRGGTMTLRRNIDKASDRFYVEWVPPMNGKTDNKIDWNINLSDIQNELSSVPGVLSHNLFASENCCLVNLDNYETDYRNVIKMMVH